MARSGVSLATPGMKRLSVTIRKTALAARAPLKPATNEVQPVRKPARGPKASRRYTYSPPAFGLSAASSAYAMAPMNASTPPPAQARRNQVASGIAAATAGERKRMPPPMTLAMMMAAASKGPRRRSRTWGSLAVVVGTRGFNHNSQRPTPDSQKDLLLGNWKLGIGS